MIGFVLLAAAGLVVLSAAWVAYPWGMIRAGNRHGDAITPRSGEPTLVSVVLATRGDPEAVRLRLEDILAGNLPAQNLELIVAIDGDATRYAFPGLSPAPRRLAVVSRGADAGKAAALNAGVAAATGDLIIFADTAQRFAPEAIPVLVGAMGDLRYGAISGALQLGNEAETGSPITRYWQLERRLRAAEARWHSAIGVTGAIYAMRRSLWSPLPAGLILDDLWIPMRLVLSGHRVGFEPGALARDVRTTTPAQEHQRKVRTLTGNLQLLAWMPELLLPWRNPVWLQFTCHKLLRLATPFALLAVLAGTIGAAFTRSPTLGWSLVGVGAAGALIIGVLPGATGRRLRRALVWVMTMQGAILKATWNGMRGRWDVWHA